MPFKEVVYWNRLSQVCWSGIRLIEGGELDTFMKQRVSERLNDTTARNEFESFARAIPSTGMAKENLERILTAEVLEDRDWAAGEALAEALLEETHGVILPWNMERDKRNIRCNLAGADIVGFAPLELSYVFAFGEIKTSSENICPPQVMSGSNGQMGHQIDNLACNLSTIHQLLLWLFPRVKNTKHETLFKVALENYISHDNKAASIFGVLIRDTAPNERDLRARGNNLGRTIEHPTSCDLIAVYLPFGITELQNKIRCGQTT